MADWEPDKRPEAWHEQLCMVRERIQMSHHRLKELAETMAKAGNEKIAKEIELEALVTEQCAEQLTHTTGIIVVKVVHDAEQSSRNVLNAALAGALAGSKT